MSAHPGHPTLRSRIAAALASLLAETSASEIGRRLGLAPSTIGRRGDELAHWPADHLLALAVDCSDLSRAIATYLRGEQVEGRATSAVRHAHKLLAGLGAETAQIATDLTDGRITSAEASAELPQIDHLIEQLQEYRADLLAITEGAR